MFDYFNAPLAMEAAALLDQAALDLRELAVTAETDRKPSAKLLEMLANGAFDPADADPHSLVDRARHYGCVDPGVALAIIGTWQAHILVTALGSEAQRESLTGQLTTSMMYEGFGRQPSEYRTTAIQRDDRLIVNGTKESVTNQGAAKQFVVVYRTDAGALGAALIDSPADGLSIIRDDCVEGKLGMRSVQSSAVRLTDVSVPVSAQLTSGESALAADRAVALSRCLLSAVAIGCSQACLDDAIKWAKERHAFGKPIAAYQGVSFPLADMATAINSAQLLLWDAVAECAKSEDRAEIERRTARSVARSMALVTSCSRDAINTYAMHGLIDDNPVERWYRAAGGLAAIDFDPLTEALEVA